MSSKHRVLVDENLGEDVLSFLRKYSRLKASSTREVLPAGASDDAVIKYAKENRLLLLTNDKNLDEHNRPVCTHFGILVVKMSVIAKRLIARLRKIFQSGHMKGCYHAVVHIHESYFEIVSADGRSSFRYD